MKPNTSSKNILILQKLRLPSDWKDLIAPQTLTTNEDPLKYLEALFPNLNWKVNKVLGFYIGTGPVKQGIFSGWRDEAIITYQQLGIGDEIRDQLKTKGYNI